MPTPLAFNARKPPEHMSFSQASSLLSCGEQYRLTRILGVPDPSGWALVGGKATHRATELYDRAYEALVHGDAPKAGQAHGSVKNEEQTPVRTASGGAGQERAGTRTPAVGADVTGTDSERQMVAAATEAARAVIEFNADAAKPYLATLADLALRDELSVLAESTGESESTVAESLRVSGRASATWPEKENRAWWEHHLPSFLHDWARWREESGFRIAYANGLPAIESDVSGVIGGVSVKAYLDRAMLHPAGGACVVDIKSNANEPSDPEQLGLYSVLLAARGLPRPRWGAYWMARKGDLGKVHDLTRYTPEYFEWKLSSLKRQRDNGELIPNTKSQFCGSCSVRPYCWAVGGKLSNQVPQIWQKTA